MQIPDLIATQTSQLANNALREILKVATRPGMISLAGGVPSPQSFSLALMAELTQTVMDRYGAQALQYDRTEGFGPLREVLVGYLKCLGICIHSDGVVITSGSQGALDSLGRVLIDPGDFVAVESPTYVGALQAFNPYKPRYVSLPTDEQGIVPEGLEQALTSRPIKFIYLVPTFQNPSGRTLTLERRIAIARLIKRHRVLLIEDDPYHSLRYQGGAVMPIKQLAPDQVVYVGTFSKILAPGLRVGFCVAPESIQKWMVIVKQGIDLHSGTFSQAIAAEFLAGGHLDGHLPRLRSLYAPKLEAMLEALDNHFRSPFEWSRPQGGMFVWMRGPAGFDSQSLYGPAVDRGLAFVPGHHFFADPCNGRNTLRLNFTMPTAAQIENAIARLAELIGQTEFCSV